MRILAARIRLRQSRRSLLLVQRVHHRERVAVEGVGHRQVHGALRASTPRTSASMRLSSIACPQEDVTVVPCHLPSVPIWQNMAIHDQTTPAAGGCQAKYGSMLSGLKLET